MSTFPRSCVVAGYGALATVHDSTHAVARHSLSALGCRGDTPASRVAASMAHGCAAPVVAVGPAKGAGQSWAATQPADPLFLGLEAQELPVEATIRHPKAALEAAC
jgi:hypothetical protein